MTDARIHSSGAGRAGVVYPAVAGFTLIELVITIAVVGILMAIAITSYEFATIKTRRGAAQGCLLEAAQYMERYYTTNFKYTGAAIPACTTDVTPHYTIAFSGTPDATTYVMQATPVAGSRQESGDAKCGTLGINQTGTKTASGPAGVAGCW